MQAPDRIVQDASRLELLVDEKGEWLLAPVFLLRQSGVPFRRLDELRRSDVVERCATVLDASAELEQLRRRRRDADRRAALSGATARYRDAVESAEEEAGVAHAGDIERLRVIFRDPSLRDALMQTMARNYDVFFRWLDADPCRRTTSKDRQKADTLALFLQRLCAKNETTSHFGPFSVGVVGGAAGITWSGRGRLRRRVFFSHWAMRSLLWALFGGVGAPEDAVVPRRRPLTLSMGETLGRFVYDADGRLNLAAEVSLDPTTREVLRLCDGARSRREVEACAAELGLSAEQVDAALRCLVAQEVLLDLAPEVPVGIALPADAGLSAVGAHALADAAVAFQEAPYADRPARLSAIRESFAGLTGEAAVRGDGVMYSDRSVVYEECTGGFHDLGMGAGMAAGLRRDVSRYAELLLAAPGHRLTLERAAVTRWYRHWFGVGVRAPLGSFLARFTADRAALQPEFDRVSASLCELHETVERQLLPVDASDADVWQLDRGDVDMIVARHGTVEALVCNADVMIAAASPESIARGEYSAVVGECHALRELLSHSSFAPMILEEVPALAGMIMQGYAAILGDDEVLGEAIRLQDRKTEVQVSLPCWDVEVIGRSPKPRNNVLALDELHVVDTAAGIRLHASRLGAFVRLSAPARGGVSRAIDDPLAVFALPRHQSGGIVRAGGRRRVPRVVMGTTVLQRATWALPRAEAAEMCRRHADAGHARGILGALAMRRRLGLPRRVFLKLADEPKPIMVDFESPLLMQQAARLIQHAGSGDAVFSEMLPGPDQLWLPSEGGAVTSELRLALFRRARTAPEVR